MLTRPDPLARRRPASVVGTSAAPDGRRRRRPSAPSWLGPLTRSIGGILPGCRAPRTRSTLSALVSAAVAVSMVAPAASAETIGPDRCDPTISTCVTAGPVADYTGPVSSANARFIVAAYQQLLGRDPDTAGLDYHVARLTSGGTRAREQFVYGLLFSPEGSRHEVRRAYLALLERNADAAGEDYWTNHLAGHGVLDLRVLLLASDEYHHGSGGADGAWLDAVYRDELGRGVDGTGAAYWSALLDAGLPRALVVAGIQQSDEALRGQARTYYREVLAREPSSYELAGAVEVLRIHGGRTLRARLWASEEAFETHLRAAWPS